MKSNAFTTLSQATSILKGRGFDQDFDVINENEIKNLKTKQCYNANEVTILEHHRFEGATNPSDTSVLYAIQTKDNTKGCLIDAYGAEASRTLGEFLRKVEQPKK